MTRSTKTLVCTQGEDFSEKLYFDQSCEEKPSALIAASQYLIDQEVNKGSGNINTAYIKELNTLIETESKTALDEVAEAAVLLFWCGRFILEAPVTVDVSNREFVIFLDSSTTSNLKAVNHFFQIKITFNDDSVELSKNIPISVIASERQ